MEVKDIQRTNRVYASKEKTGTIKKVKLNVEKIVDLNKKENLRKYNKGEFSHLREQRIEDNVLIGYYDRYDKVANIPDNVIIDNDNTCSIDDIDIEWYINLAKERIIAIGGKEMATATKKQVTEVKVVAEPNIELSPERKIASNLYKKVFQLTKYFEAKGKELEKDGYNSGQKYEYVKSSQYKTLLRAGCLEVGLVFKIAIDSFEKIDLSKDTSMTAIGIKGYIYLVDIDTAEQVVYPAAAIGADSLDKQISKAETLLIKDFIKGNFLVSDDDSDPEADNVVETVVKVENKKPKSTTERKEITEEIVKTATKPNSKTDKLIDKIVEMIIEMREIKDEPTYASKSMNAIEQYQEDNSLMTAKEIKQLYDKVEGIYYELKNSQQ